MRPMYVVCVGLALVASGCADDLQLPTSDAGADAAVAPVTTRMDGDARVTTINAIRDGVWVYVDFDTGAMSGEMTPGWDLAFQRFKVMSNGGSSGMGGVAVNRVNGSFASVTMAPSDGWFLDQEDGPDENTDPDYAFSQQDGWYAYNVMDHSLSPRDVVYFVRSTEGRVFKLRMEGYYDTAGTSGYPRFRWAAL